jgi:hypothetical protein
MLAPSRLMSGFTDRENEGPADLPMFEHRQRSRKQPNLRAISLNATTGKPDRQQPKAPTRATPVGCWCNENYLTWQEFEDFFRAALSITKS